MGMIHCPECGGVVSDRLKKCPHCGCSIDSKQDKYSQFYEKSKTYQPETQLVNRIEDAPKRKKSSKSTALSISAMIISLMGFLMSFIAIVVAESSHTTESAPQEIKEQEYPTEIEEAEKEDYASKEETPVEEVKEEKPNSSNGKINYSAAEPIFYTFINSIGDMEYCFIQEIKNTGDCPLYLKGCDLDIEDESGHLIATENFISSCPDIILPGEIGYFYNSLGATILNESARTAESLKAAPSLDIVESYEQPIEYEISDISITKGTFDYPTITGRVTNNTEEDDSLVYINVIFYDKNENVITIAGVNVQDLTSGSTKGFECTALTSGSISYEDIGNYKVIARKTHYQF